MGNARRLTAEVRARKMAKSLFVAGGEPMPSKPGLPKTEPEPPNEDIVLVGGPWDGWDFAFATPDLQELWFLDRNLVVNQLARDAATKAFNAEDGSLDPDVLFGDIRRNAKKMADLTMASVYHRRPGTNTFDFVRSEPVEVFDRLAGEGYFDGTARQKGC
jgi:hypothetical protein